MSYNDQAIEDAKDMAIEFVEQIAESYRDHGQASIEGNETLMVYHHERNEDHQRSFAEACKIMVELEDHEETDKGVFGHGGMKEQLIGCAAFTYANAVMHHFRRIIEAINMDARLAKHGDIEKRVRMRIKLYNGE